MKYVKIYNEKMQCLGVADIEQNYDKDGYVKLFDATTIKFRGVVDVDDIPESGDNMPVVKVFDENMRPCGVVTADNIRHSDGYLITLQKDPSTTGAVTGGGRFIAGTSVTVVATPDTQSEYPEFDGWYEGETKVSENASYTFTVSGARTLVAKFKEATPVITYTADAKLTETTSDKNAGLHTNAFDDATITSHTFENGVGKISFNKPVVVVGEYAFFKCSGLTSVTIPNSVTEIGMQAFDSCTSLISVVCNSIVPPPLLGYNAFANNHNERKIYVPAGSVDAYKADGGWSTYARDIEAIQE